jgi:hypothetical protein
LSREGNSVLIIEHNVDIIKCADWLIDLGPEGGLQRRHLLFEGTPETADELKTVPHRGLAGVCCCPPPGGDRRRMGTWSGVFIAMLIWADRQ